MLGFVGAEDAAVLLVQFGAAGLIGWLWLAERRSASERDTQIREAHERVRRDRLELGVLVAALERNTRALAGLEAGQRAIGSALERLAGPGGGGGGGVA